jgi:hypothetical protein
VITEKSYGFDFMNTLAQRIADLAGFPVMCRELLQNADDEGCDQIEFQFNEAALIVRNPGLFTDRDRENIRMIGSEGKIKNPQKTGRFGFGFVSVFQICDAPIIRSSGHALTIRPEIPRVYDDDGDRTAGTEFELSWAYEDTAVRRALKKQPVSRDIALYAKELLNAVAPMMLFLRRIRKVLIWAPDGSDWVCSRLKDDGHVRTVTLTSGGSVMSQRKWFVAEVNHERDRSVGETERSDAIGIAMELSDPPSERPEGMVYCTLPTRTATGLPVSVNGDFAVHSDRATILVGGSAAEDEWNRELAKRLGALYADAITAATREIELEHYVQMLPPDKYGNPSCELFNLTFEEFLRLSQGRALLPVSGGASDGRVTWHVASDVRFLSRESSPNVYDGLVRIGVRLVASELQPRWNLLSNRFKVMPFKVADLANSLRDVGVQSGQSSTLLPEALHDADCRTAAWSFLENQLRDDRTRVEREAAKRIPLCPCTDDTYCEFGECHAVEADLIEAVPLLAECEGVVDSEFLAERKDLCGQLCTASGLDLVVEELKDKKACEILKEQNAGRLDLPKLYDYIAERRGLIAGDVKLKSRLAELVIYPARKSGVTAAIADLSLPGNFHDPIGLDILLDDSRLGPEHISAFKALGLQPLTALEYLRRVAFSYFSNHERFGTDDKRIELLKVVRDEIVKLEAKDAEDVLGRIKGTCCVKCSDGLYRVPNAVYLTTDPFPDLFTKLPIPAVDYGTPLGQSWMEILLRLGVQPVPALDAYVELLSDLAALPPAEGIGSVERVFYQLAGGFDKLSDSEKKVMGRLAYLEWLPDATGTKYYLPSVLHLNSHAKLVGNAGRTLRFSRERDMARGFRAQIGLIEKPTIVTVLANLRDLKGRGAAADTYIYRYLSQEVNNLTGPEKTALGAEQLLWLGDEPEYARGSQVYWSENPFPGYRHELPEYLREYRSLMLIMGVKDRATPDDYLSVLEDVSAAYQKDHHAVEKRDEELLRTVYAQLSRHLGDAGEDAPNIEERWRKCCRGKPVVLTNVLRFKPPEICFFADKDWAVKIAGDKVKDLLVDKDQWTAGFLRAIGVTSIGSALAVEDFQPPVGVKTSLFQVALRFPGRKKALKRIIETFKGKDPESRWQSHDVENLLINECHELTVRYVLRVGGKSLALPERRHDSYVDNDSLILYLFDECEPELKQLEAARQIAGVMNPEIDAAFLSPYLSLLIDSGRDEGSLTRTLTRMGIDQLAETEEPALQSGVPAQESENVTGRQPGGGVTGGQPSGGGGGREGVPGKSEGASGNTNEAAEVHQRMLAFLKERVQRYCQLRLDFESKDNGDDGDHGPGEPLDGEERERHLKQIRVFYNREIQAIKTRMAETEKRPIYGLYGPDWPDTSREVRGRDGDKCRRCGATEDELRGTNYRLEVHHIVRRGDGGSNWHSNLITLCTVCHREVEANPDLL